MTDARTSETATAAGLPSGTPRAHKRTLWILGLGGLIPFVAATGLLLYAGRTFIAYPQLVLALAGYSAAILSFLGGIRWGAALARHDAAERSILALSVLPSIFGWLCLFAPAPWVFAAFALGFLAQGAWDVLAVRAGTLPAEFGRLRLVLTAVVVLCQLAAFAATFASAA